MTDHIPNHTQSIDHKFENPGIPFSFTDRPDMYTGKSQYAGVDSPTPEPEEKKRGPSPTNDTNYCAIAFTSEDPMAINPEFGNYQTGQFFLPTSHSVGTANNELGYLVGVRNGHVSKVVYDVPYVIDGYDHEKALLIRFAARVYIEEVTIAEIAAEEQQITDAKRAEGAQIVVEEATLAAKVVERIGRGSGREETAATARNVAERSELMAVAAKEYAAMMR